MILNLAHNKYLLEKKNSNETNKNKTKTKQFKIMETNKN